MQSKILMGVIILVVIMIATFWLLQPNNPNTSCQQDSDCVLRQTSCQPCDCGSPVNKNWKPFCPTGTTPPGVICGPCQDPQQIQIRCIQNQCRQTN